MLTNKQETGNSKFLGSFDQLEQAIYRVGYCFNCNRITLNSSGARWRGRRKEGLVGNLAQYSDSYSHRGFGWALRGNTNTRRGSLWTHSQLHRVDGNSTKFRRLNFYQTKVVRWPAGVDGTEQRFGWGERKGRESGTLGLDRIRKLFTFVTRKTSSVTKCESCCFMHRASCFLSSFHYGRHFYKHVVYSIHCLIKSSVDTQYYRWMGCLTRQKVWNFEGSFHMYLRCYVTK